jgi:putative membrane protein
MSTLQRMGLVAAAAALAWLPITSAGAAPAPTPGAARLSASDRPVIQKLHDLNQLEIQMGNLAQEKGTSKAVRSFGKTLVTDHERADRQLDDYLRKRGSGLKLLATTTSIDADHDLLATRTGTEFDRAFGLQMIADHQKAIDMLESARIATGDDDLRAIYEALLPTLRDHKRAAQDIVAASARS